MRYRQHEKTFSAGYRLTTNNRMELMAAIVALEALKSIAKWCSAPTASMSAVDHPVDPQLEKARLENGREKPVKNVDLWQRLDAALGQHKIKWEWVKGHAGHPENERCDELARAAASHPTQDDIGYQPES